MRRPPLMTLAISGMVVLTAFKAAPLYNYASRMLVTPAQASSNTTEDEILADMPVSEEAAEISRPDVDELLLDISVERKALQKWREELELKEAKIALAQSALEENARNLEDLRSELEYLLDRTKRENTEDVMRLAEIYNAMKPAQAAAIMDEADIEVAVLVLAAMKPRDSGPIIALMNPTRARAISKIILERSRLPGDQDLVGVQLN